MKAKVKIKKTKDNCYRGIIRFGRNVDGNDLHVYKTRKCITEKSAKRYCDIFIEKMFGNKVKVNTTK